MHRSVGHRVDHRTDIGAQRREVVTTGGRTASPVASDFGDDRPATEQWEDFCVVLGDVGHAGHEDDRSADITTGRVQVVNASIAAFGEPRSDHG